jgi:hypothetical protein
MTTILGILTALGFVGVLGAVWERVGKRRRRTLAASDAEQMRAKGTLDYYEKVWDSGDQ